MNVSEYMCSFLCFISTVMTQEGSTSSHSFTLIHLITIKHLFGREIAPDVISFLEQISMPCYLVCVSVSSPEKQDPSMYIIYKRIIYISKKSETCSLKAGDPEEPVV